MEGSWLRFRSLGDLAQNHVQRLQVEAAPGNHSQSHKVNYPRLPKHTNRQPGKFTHTRQSKALTLASRPPRRSRTPANDRTSTTTQPVIVDQRRDRRLSRPEEIAIQETVPAPRSKSNFRQSPD